MITRSQSGIVKPIDRLSLNTFLISPIPKNPSNALKDPRWRNAMYDEYNASNALKNPSNALKDPRWRNAMYDEYNASNALKNPSNALKDPHLGSHVAYLLLYVDDIILTDSSTSLLQQLIDSLHRLFLSQRKYALQLLERAHMVSCNPSRTPVDTESKLGLDGVLVQDPTMYRSLARGIQYLT
ncbi:ribonuclease H-like domain-containing protein, partial [Tanacetum coccineum]